MAWDNILLDPDKTYKMIMAVKGSKSGKLDGRLGDWGGGTNVTFNFTNEWQEVEISVKPTMESSFLLLHVPNYVGDVFIKSIRFEGNKPARMISQTKQEMHDTLGRQSDALALQVVDVAGLLCSLHRDWLNSVRHVGAKVYPDCYALFSGRRKVIQREVAAQGVNHGVRTGIVDVWVFELNVWVRFDNGVGATYESHVTAGNILVKRGDEVCVIRLRNVDLLAHRDILKGEVEEVSQERSLLSFRRDNTPSRES